MASLTRNIRDLWRQTDPTLRLFALVFFIVLLWRLVLAILALPGVNLNMRDYIWMTKFFGMSDLLYVGLVFTGFGLIPALTSAIFFASVTSLVAWACARARVPARRFSFSLSVAALACLAICYSIGPSLQTALATLTGAPVTGWIAVLGELLLVVIVIRALASRHMKDLRRQRKRKPA